MQLASGPLAWPPAWNIAGGLRRLLRPGAGDHGDVLRLGSTQAKGARNIPRRTSSQRARDEERRAATGRAHRPLQRLRESSREGRVRWNVTPQLLRAARSPRGFRAPLDPRERRVESLLLPEPAGHDGFAPSTPSTAARSRAGIVLRQSRAQARESDSWTGGFVWEPTRGVSLGRTTTSSSEGPGLARDFQFILDTEALYQQ